MDLPPRTMEMRYVVVVVNRTKIEKRTKRKQMRRIRISRSTQAKRRSRTNGTLLRCPPWTVLLWCGVHPSESLAKRIQEEVRKYWLDKTVYSFIDNILFVYFVSLSQTYYLEL